MNDSKYDEIAVDGMLTDTSFDFNEPSVKNPKTPAEKRKEQAEKRALAKAKREAKLAAKKNTLADSIKIQRIGGI